MINYIRNGLHYFAAVIHGWSWKLGFFLFANKSHVSGLLRVASGSHYKLFGRNTAITIKPQAYIRHNCSLVVENGLLEIGSYFFLNSGSSINVHNHIRIGDDCIFGEGVKLYDHDHRFKIPGTVFNQQGFSVGEIIIGNNVWLGTNVVILKNTIIGDNVVVGANTVIKGNIPSNSIVTQARDLNIQPINFSR